MPWTWLAASESESVQVSSLLSSYFTSCLACCCSALLPRMDFVRLVASLYQFVFIGKVLFAQDQALCPHVDLVLYSLMVPGVVPAC